MNGIAQNDKISRQTEIDRHGGGRVTDRQKGRITIDSITTFVERNRETMKQKDMGKDRKIDRHTGLGGGERKREK